MDDDLKELETELKRLNPVAPSAACINRLHHALAPGAIRRSPARRPGWWWLALPAAALFAVIFTRWEPVEVQPAAERSAATPTPAAVPAPDGTTLKPVAARNLLYAADDEGLVVLDDGTPAHRERLHYVDTITWRDPRTNASLQWSVPREEVRIVPVQYR